ncbi:hypothetical protein PLICRDRAFT_366051 [Plicaturopsis crispa FD-325 SS-3]|uniref:Unplaced genomic scaffold PLICRscaffold_18, whole genome shotgun sequence n=1 Tax=Plicaturopsis crispa FD-325 SS-3 TaxID=944288 RepID=A0A0C9SR86_PLICR|nr:hypothetical protein PLICRDRAFT_366051 [Plicaturopsis crispa FD-325 SS-3]
MGSKESHTQIYPAFESRRRVSLHIETPAFSPKVEDDSGDDYPPSSASQSPITPANIRRPRSASAGSDSIGPSSGPQRVASGSGKKNEREREKRKRSRVTPDQLVHLEQFFAGDRSPTAARRKEISELLGMHERQTQIWFQNRRAKAKLQGGKAKGRPRSAETPPEAPPALSTGYDEDLHSLIHEDEPVTIIPCTDLSVGSWRRIATSPEKHDLVAYLCDAKRCLTWFIHSAGYGFKMEIPFSYIVDTEFTNAAPGSGLASFTLSQPPLFYLEHVPSPEPNEKALRYWKRCADWTEGQQATKILRHDLIGSAVQLVHVLRNLHLNTPNTDVQLHSPPYYESSASPMELPQPSMVSTPGFQQDGDGADIPPEEFLQIDPRRAHSVGPSNIAPRSYHDPVFLAQDTPTSAPFPPSFPSPTARSAPLNTPLFFDYSVPDVHTGESDEQGMLSTYAAPLEYGVPSSISPPYSAPPVLYRDGVQIISQYPNPPSPNRVPQRTFEHFGQLSPDAPMLLTTPYYPSESSVAPGDVIASGIAAVSYESESSVQ